MQSHKVLLTRLALPVLMFALVLSSDARGAAQPAAPPVMPPSYDYDAAAPGVQGPTSPLLAAPDLRSFRAHQLGFGVLVPLAELQAMLPAGFVPVASAPGADTAMLGLTFVYQVRTESAGGLVGPSSGVYIGATVTNVALARQESLFLTAVLNDQATIDGNNAVLGPGSFRLGEVAVEIEEQAGTLSFAFDVTDAGLGLRIRARAAGPAAMLNHAKFDPQPAPFRFINTGGAAGPASRVASQADNQTIPVATADLKFKANGGELKLPGGNLTIAGLGPSVTLARWVEVITKRE